MRLDDFVVPAAGEKDRGDRCENCYGCVSNRFLDPAGPDDHGFCEPVTASGHCLNVVREHRTQAADDDVHAVLEANVDVGPKPRVNLFTSHELARPSEKQAKQFQGLASESEIRAPEFQGLSDVVELKLSECLDHSAIVAI